MTWLLSHRADPRARVLADRHYSRKKPGTPQFVKPGRCIVLRTGDGTALWVSSWPFAEYVQHAWAGAWECSLFRNEGSARASDLIRAAVAHTRAIWGEPPALGMVTFINPACVTPIQRRGQALWGYCYLKADFVQPAETTKGGKLVFQLTPERMPEPYAAREEQGVLAL